MDRPDRSTTTPAGRAPGRQTYLVERYWPDIDEDGARRHAASLDEAARTLTSEGVTVEHLGSILMPRDQVVFSLVEAADEAAARQLTTRADTTADRIALAIRLSKGDACTHT